MSAHVNAPLYRTGYMLTLGAGFNSLSGFVFWLIAAHRFSPLVVGMNSAAISAMMLVSTVSQLGLNAVLVRYLPAAGRSTRAVLATTYVVTTVLSATTAYVVAVTTPHWLPRLDFLSSPRWVVSFVVATVAWSVFTLQDSALTGMRAAHWVPIENAAFSAGKLLLLFVPVGFAMNSGVFFAWNAPALLTLAPVNFFIFGKLISRHRERSPSRLTDRRSLARFAGANYLGSLLLLGSTTLLPIIVATRVGTKETAYFYVPWTIAMGMQLIALSMTTSLTVEVAFDESRLREYVRLIAIQTARLLVPVSLAFAVSAPYILRIFGRVYATHGSTLLALLALGTIPNVIVLIGLAVARIQHDGRGVLLIQAATCLGTIGLAAPLLALIGIDGVAVAWLVTQAAVAAWLLSGRLRRVLLHAESVAGGAEQEPAPASGLSVR